MVYRRCQKDKIFKRKTDPHSTRVYPISAKFDAGRYAALCAAEVGVDAPRSLAWNFGGDEYSFDL